jgi:hypothetical protein
MEHNRVEVHSRCEILNNRIPLFVSKKWPEQLTWECEIMLCVVNHYQFLWTNYGQNLGLRAAFQSLMLTIRWTPYQIIPTIYSISSGGRVGGHPGDLTAFRLAVYFFAFLRMMPRSTPKSRAIMAKGTGRSHSFRRIRHA